MQEKSFPKRAKMVGVGLGEGGASAVYHCAHKGVKDMVWLDRGRLYQTGGSTTHTSGIVQLFSFSKLNTFMRDYSREVFEGLLRFGQGCFDKVGMWDFASSPERWEDIQRRYETSLSWGRPRTELLTPEQIKEKLPPIDERRLLGALYQPDGGLVDATLAAEIMAREAQEMGAASVWGETNVTGIDIRDGQVRGVQTSRGYIETENVVICAGVWGNEVAKMAGVTLPMWKVEHANVTLGPFSDPEKYRGRVRATGRDQGLGIYFRTMLGEGDEWGDYSPANSRRLYDPRRKLDPEDGPDYFPILDEFPVPDFTTTPSPAERRFTMEEMEKYLEFPISRAKQLFPYTGDEPSFMHITNGLIAVTPDESPIIGEWPGVKGLWFVERIWIAEAPGAGKIFADVFVDDVCEWGDVSEVSPWRFFKHQLNKKYILGRVWEYAGCVYEIMHPDVQFEKGRGIKKSPIYDIEQKSGAEFWEAGGQERGMWHNCNNALRKEYSSIVDRPEGSWEAKQYSSAVAIESLHTSKYVSLTDLSSFGKFWVKDRVKGSGAARAFVDYFAVSRMPRVGRAMYTQLLNEFGGIKSDLTIQRIGLGEFLVITGAAVAMEDFRWLQKYLPADGSVRLTNVTDRYAVYGLWGPHARDVLEQVTDSDVSNDAFHYMDTQEITIHGVPVRAFRVSFVGELGWEIYINRFEGRSKNDENARIVYGALWESGQAHRIIPMGLYAYRGPLRIRKNYPLLAPQSDLNVEHNPIGAGVFKNRYMYGDGYTQDIELSQIKDRNFIGRQSLLDMMAQENPPEEIRCILEMRNPPRVIGAGAWPILNPHTHAVIKYAVDGKSRSSYVTSSSSADTLTEREGEEIVLAMCYLPFEYAKVGTEVKIGYLGKRLAATVAVVGSEPLHDPENTFMRI